VTRFTYEAITSAGVVVTGKSSEPNSQQVVDSLRARGLQPLKVRRAGNRFSFELNRQNKLKDNELLVIVNGLARLLLSGIALEKALEVLISHQNPKKRPYRFVQLLLTYVRDGTSLSTSLESSEMLPRGAAKPLLALVLAGEQSGVLGNNLLQASDMMRTRLETRKNIQSALAYPLIIMFVALFTVIFMGSVIAPAFQTMFEDFGKETPAILVGLKGFAESAPQILLTVAFVGLFMRLNSKLGKTLQTWFGELVLSLPYVSTLVFQRDIANFSFLLGNLLKGDVELVSALKLSVSGIENRVLAEKIQMSALAVADGQSLATVFAKIKGMPIIFSQLSQIGEANGTLAEMLHQISENLRSELQETLQKITTLLPVVMIVLLGSMIASLVASIFGAILDVNDLAF